MSEFKLPDVGEGLTEAEIVTWRVSVGDTVAINDVLVDIETAKSVVELPSPFEGTVRTLLVDEGQTVQVGTPIISIGDDAAPADTTPAAPVTATANASDTSKAPADGQERQPVLVGYGPRDSGAPQRRRRRRAEPALASTGAANGEAAPPAATAAAPTAPPAGTCTEPTTARGPALAKPPVRKLAKDLDIDLHDVPAAGPVITREDVENYADNHAGVTADGRAGRPEPAVSVGGQQPGDRDTAVPVKGVRKQMAAAMVESAFTAPHATEWITVDVSESMTLIDRLAADRRFADVKITPLTLAARAVCLAARTTPEVNAHWDAAGEQVILRGDINLGIAAATPRGLLVPNIVGAGQMGLADLAEAIGELTETARQGRTQPEQMAGGTFTITNVGVFGVDGGTPIINPGESAILAIGAVNRRPWVDENDQIVPRWVTTLAVSFDHRIVDGEQGSRFLADVAAILREPSMALTF